MAQGEGFKHITLTAPEEDDVVIVAGACELRQDEPAQRVSRAGESLHSEQPQPDNAAVEHDRPARKAHRLPKDDYHETTLADLESNPMPLAQKIVIIVAVLCIIGAVVYYFAFMS